MNKTITNGSCGRGIVSRIVALDGMRAIAISLVLSAHGCEAFLSFSHLWWMAPITNGELGVRLFFVLSGYLITSLLMREQARHGDISLRDFYIRRTLRIFPAFYLYLAVIAGLVGCGWIAASGAQFAAAATYTWNYLGLWQSSGPAQGAWFLGHLWTLSLEEQFYLFWPGLIVLGGWRWARIVAILIPLTAPFVRIGIYAVFPDQRGLLGMMFHTAIDSILIGCAFAIWQQRIPPWALGRLCVIGAAAYAFLISPCLAHHFRGDYSITVGVGMDAVCCGILIINAQRAGNWSRVLSWGPLCLLGTWSYSLYFWQQLFLTGYVKPWTGGPLWALSATFACALLSHYLVEKPVLKMKDQFQRR